jgi:AcrR family transcriptional regulator
MMTTTRRERQREAARVEIKAIARAQMRQTGSGSISLRGIAEQMGFTVTAIYRYYENLDALITALIVDSFNELADRAQAAVDTAPAGDYRAQLLAAMEAYRAYAVENPTDFHLIYGTPIPGYSAPREVTVPAAVRIGIVLGRVLTAAIRAGKCRPDLDRLHIAPETVAAMTAALEGIPGADPLASYLTAIAWSRGHGYVMLEITGHITPLVGEDNAFFRQECQRILDDIGLT